MKKTILILFVGFLLNSCSSDSSSGTNLTNTPNAKVEYDNSNFGIYKGVFVGSSGNVLININNDGALSAKLVIDGITYNYTTTENVTLNTAILGLTFTNGNSTFDFNVDATGNQVSITNIVISGHPNADIYVIKEYSDALVKCYQGTYNGDDTGVFNLIISDGEIYGLAKSNSDTSTTELYGLMSNNTITGSFENGTYTGNISGNNISGTWSNSSSDSGSWSGSRKL
jgi:hypothetical protein